MDIQRQRAIIKEAQTIMDAIDLIQARSGMLLLEYKANPWYRVFKGRRLELALRTMINAADSLLRQLWQMEE